MQLNGFSSIVNKAPELEPHHQWQSLVSYLEHSLGGSVLPFFRGLVAYVTAIVNRAGTVWFFTKDDNGISEETTYA